MKSLGDQERMTGRGSNKTLAHSTWTRTMMRAARVTGTTECMTMHRGQWSASVTLAWRWATWTTARKASRMRHTTVAAFKGTALERRLRAVRDWLARNTLSPT